MVRIDVGGWLSGGKFRPSDPCGLLFTSANGGKQQAVPLKRREVAAEICTSTGFADAKETFYYVSDVDCTCTFKFPLPPGSAIYRFRAVLGDREVVTAVKPRAQAQEEYSLAVAQGHGAVLMAQQPDSASLFEVSIGNLEALSEAVVEVRYLRMLDAMGDTLEWLHTATWVPPYIGSAGDVAAGLQQVAAAEPKFAAKVSYSLSYTITIDSAIAPLRAIDSAQPITVKQPGPSMHVVTLSEAVCDPSRDLTLLLELAPGARASGVRAQRSPDGFHTVALATFVPRAEELAQLQREHREQQQQMAAPTSEAPSVAAPPTPALGLPPPFPVPGTAPAPPATPVGPSLERQPLLQELWLVVDCSGSMHGEAIEQARQAALFFVRDLPTNAGVRFNVTCFGSSYHHLHFTPQPYTPATEQQAVTWVQQHVQANMGGTEILKTLQYIYGCPVSSGYTRQILFLTDGGISGHEEQALLALAASGSPRLGAPGLAPATTTPAQPAFKFGIDAVTTASVPAPAPAQPVFKFGMGAIPAAQPAGFPTVVHCLGIGHGVHRGVLDGMAARSGGACVCVVDDEAIARKVAFLRKCALGGEGALLRPRLVARGALVRSVPHVLPDRIFAGEPLHILVETISSTPDAVLELTATLAGPGNIPYSIALPLGAAVAACPGATNSAPAGAAGTPDTAEGRPQALCVLHAMAYIGSLLEGTSPLHKQADGNPVTPPPAQDVVRDAVVRLAVASHLVTPHTSAVGVVLRHNPLDPAAVTRSEVPLALPAGRTMFGRGLTQKHQGPSFSCPAFGPAGCVPAPALFGGSPFGSSAGAGAGNGFGSPPPPPSGVAFGFGAAPAPCFGASSAASTASLFGPTGFCFGAPAAPPTPSPFSDGTSPQRSSAANQTSSAFGGNPTPNTFGGFGSQQPASAPAPPSSAFPTGLLPAAELVSFLNLLRTTQGYWEASKRLTDALGLPLEAVTPAAGVYTHAVCGVRPVGLSDDAFATLLALAVLRRRCGAQREVWADMEAKALAWLGGVWPAGAGRSAAACVLALAKLVPDA